MSHLCQPELLGICQELRDIIFKYAIEEEMQSSAASTNNVLSVKAQQSEWTLYYARRAPAPVYLNLTSTNRQLYHEAQTYLTNTNHYCPPAEIILNAAHPHLIPQWSHLSCPPEHISDLTLHVKLSNLFNPALSTRSGQHDVLLRPIYEVLKRFTTHGPFMGREKALARPLKLRTLRVVLASAVPLDDMIHVYGSPQTQLNTLHSRLVPLLMRLAGSGMLADVATNDLELRLEGCPVVRLDINQGLLNEADYVYFSNLGFQ